MIGQKAKDKSQPIKGSNIRSNPHRVNRGRISVPARVGALGALLSARPHGLGNASTGRGGIQGRRQRRQRRQRRYEPATIKATLPHRHHRDTAGSYPEERAKHHHHLRLISARRLAAASPRATSTFVAAVTPVLITSAAAFISPFLSLFNATGWQGAYTFKYLELDY